MRKFKSDREEFLEFAGERFGFGKEVNPMFEITDNEAKAILKFCGREKNGLAIKGRTLTAHWATSQAVYGGILQKWQELISIAAPGVHCIWIRAL